MNEYITLYLPTPSFHFYGLFKYTRFGFGFDQCNNAYKVVRAFCEYEEENHTFHTHFSVYTLGVDSSWRNLEVEISYFLYSSGQNTPLVHGIFHWLARKIGPSSFAVIIGFGIQDEAFYEMPPPSGIDLNAKSTLHEIGELGGFLCIFSELENMDVEIWKMKEYGVDKSWSKFFRVASPEQYNHLFYLEAIRTVHNKNDSQNLNSQEGSLCYQETKMIEKLAQYGVNIFYAHTYIGSVISPIVINRGQHNLTDEETLRNEKVNFIIHITLHVLYH